ncbi:unnamed protein product [Soboliphyme baturini]|uniref:MATH domain-containing protein n=1 Tax=Soboliphyme baturini TaxID=241478 RepID=A0A183IE79_9BILA|nr:unnamed protein product [Soboliphyme baturini]
MSLQPTASKFTSFPTPSASPCFLDESVYGSDFEWILGKWSLSLKVTVVCDVFRLDTGYLNRHFGYYH